MTSRSIATANALVLGGAGLVLLFAADEVLPAFVSGLQAEAAWIGQLLGAAWLGIAALNWLSKGSVLGGIYGRPIVMANAVTYFVTTTVLLGSKNADAIPAAVLPAIFAVLYGVLLVRGPFVERHRQ